MKSGQRQVRTVSSVCVGLLELKKIRFTFWALKCPFIPQPSFIQFTLIIMNNISMRTIRDYYCL